MPDLGRFTMDGEPKNGKEGGRWAYLFLKILPEVVDGRKKRSFK